MHPARTPRPFRVKWEMLLDTRVGKFGAIPVTASHLCLENVPAPALAAQISAFPLFCLCMSVQSPRSNCELFESIYEGV